jgi:hypothetical protein
MMLVELSVDRFRLVERGLENERDDLALFVSKEIAERIMGVTELPI